jgi:hypothetical protein
MLWQESQVYHQLVGSKFPSPANRFVHLFNISVEHWSGFWGCISEQNRQVILEPIFKRGRQMVTIRRK